MGYQAKREDDYDASQSYSEQRKAQFDKDSQNNANTINNAADVAMATKHPVAVAIGGGVKAADKVTGGKSTQMLGKSMAMANRVSPGGRSVQKASNMLAESGIGDKVGQAASLAGAANGGGGGAAGGAAKAGETASKAGETAEQARKAQEASAQAQKASDTADKAKKATDVANKVGDTADSINSMKGGRDSSPSSGDDQDSDDKKGSGMGKFLAKQAIMMVAFTFAPLMIMKMLLV